MRSRALVDGLWRLFDVFVLPALMIVALFVVLARYEAARARRPETLPGQPPRYHHVVEGDDLRALSMRYYGDPRHWPELFHANRVVLQRDGLRPGQDLVIPPRGRRK